jgi:hypothetical protein
MLEVYESRVAMMKVDYARKLIQKTFEDVYQEMIFISKRQATETSS